jgi:pilus assembly protein CpaE
MESKIRIFVVDDTQETRELIGQYLGFDEKYEVVGYGESGRDAIEKLKKIDTDIVLMDINMPDINGLEATEIILKNSPHIMVIIMSVQKELEYLKKAMILGARDYIIKPFDMSVLDETIERVIEKNHYRAHVSKAPEKKYEGKVVSVFSSSGGAGKSVVSSNYGAKLFKEGRKVLIVDLDLLFGDIGLMANIKSDITVIEAINEGIHKESFHHYVNSIADNFDCILAPSKPELSEYVTVEHVESIIKIAKELYDYVIIDLPVNFDNRTLKAMDLSDRIIYLITPDVVSLKNGRLGIELMRSLNYEDNKIIVGINKYNKKLSLNLADVKKVLKLGEMLVFYEDIRLVNDSINRGQLILLNKGNRSSKFYKSLEGVVIF